MRDFAREADVAEKLDDAMDVLPLRVFIALSRGQAEPAESIVRRSASLNQLKDPPLCRLRELMFVIRLVVQKEGAVCSALGHTSNTRCSVDV